MQPIMNKTDWLLLVRIFWSFFKIGPVTFGGGYAMIPLFQKEIVDKNRWLEDKDVAEVFAVSQSIPGAIGINSAVFAGYRICGIRGALAALAGVLLPTFLIVVGLCIAFMEVRNNPKIDAAFRGIRPAVVALIAYAGLQIGRVSIKDKTTLLLAIASLLALVVTGMNPVLIIAAGIIIGMIIVPFKKKLGFEILEDKGPARYVFDDYFIGDGI